DDAPEPGCGFVPALEHVGRARRPGVAEVPLEQQAQLFAGAPPGDHELGVETQGQPAGRIEDVELAAAHSGAHVQADLAEHDDSAPGHVLAGVVADALDDGCGTGVPDCEALAGAPAREELSTG